MDPRQRRGVRGEGDDLGGTMRLGAYEAVLTPGSKIAEIYGAVAISERHRHRYEVNIGYREAIEGAGLKFTGLSPDGVLPEDRRARRPSLVHRRPVPPGTEEPPLRARTRCSPASSPRPWSRAGWSRPRPERKGDGL